MKVLPLVALACLALAASSARGALITFAFEGTVTSVQVLAPEGLDVWPEVGDPFRGTYTFDSDAVDSSDNPLSGVYTTRGALGEIQVEVGQFELEGTGFAVAVVTHDNLYEAGSNMDLISHPELAVLLDRNHFGLRVEGNSQLLDGLELPLTPPSLANASEATVTLYLDSRSHLFWPPFVTINGTLESLTLVPEPSTALLAVLGLVGGVFAVARRHKRRAS